MRFPLRLTALTSLVALGCGTRTPFADDYFPADGGALVDLPPAKDRPVVVDRPALPDVPVFPDVPVRPDVPVMPDVPVRPDVQERCPGLQMRCSGVCVDAQRDRLHCGACGNACGFSEQCERGVCRRTTSSQYTVGPSPATWVEACDLPGHTELLATTDDQAVPEMLPIDFTYWGQRFEAGATINVTSNGWFGFDGTTNAALGGQVPDMNEPNGVVAVHWGDNYTRTPGMCLATTSAGGVNTWVIEWSDAHYCCMDDPAVHLSFEAILTEGTNTLDFIYRDMRGQRPQTVGIENLDGTDGVSLCRAGEMCPVDTGSRIRFTPTP